MSDWPENDGEDQWDNAYEEDAKEEYEIGDGDNEKVILRILHLGKLYCLRHLWYRKKLK